LQLSPKVLTGTTDAAWQFRAVLRDAAGQLNSML
jgi:YD repeat-containing protein